MAHIAIPIPATDFDPTEVAVTWSVLREFGHEISFATPDGRPGSADQIMLDGIGLDPWGRVPGLRRMTVLGRILRANQDGRHAYRAMTRDCSFRAPRRWDELAKGTFDGLVLAGGHRARGMRPYLESGVLQHLISTFFASNKPVGAICHGVLLVARSRGADGKSVLHGRRTTALTWRQERIADNLAKLGRWWDRTYYRTYGEAAGETRGYMSVQAEVTRALTSSNDFVDVAPGTRDRLRKNLGLFRDTTGDSRPSFVVVDRNYVSARWPGDTHSFAVAFDAVIRRQCATRSIHPKCVLSQSAVIKDS